MKLQISHTTEYAYSAPVGYALQKVRLRPTASAVQTVQDWQIDVTGGHIETSYSDHYGNHIDLCSLDQGGQGLTIHAHGTVETSMQNGVLGTVYGRAPLWHFLQATPVTMPGKGIKALAEQITGGDTLLADLHALSATILERTPYEVGATDANTTAEQALSVGAGVCQDHAQIFVAAARHAGVPSRYVSGYLMMNETVDQDATHGWAEAHVDGLGWVGFDVSNGYSPDERYVRIAIGRDAPDAAPLRGLRMGSSEERLVVSVQVQQ